MPAISWIAKIVHRKQAGIFGFLNFSYLQGISKQKLSLPV
jgi:hypothetical protein